MQLKKTFLFLLIFICVDVFASNKLNNKTQNKKIPSVQTSEYRSHISGNRFIEHKDSNFIKAYSGKQYGFIENKGQIIDQNNKPNNEVLYLYNSNGLNVQLKQNGFSYEVIKTEKKLKIKMDNEISMPNKFDKDSFEYTFKIHRVDILFDGGNKNVLITAFDPYKNYINYFTTLTSEVGITNVQHYQKIVYSNIYPKIDVEFVLNNEKPSKGFKYNFKIHPGGNIDDIRLKFIGAINTSLTDDGHITIETVYGNIDESIPYSYQVNQQNIDKKIEAQFIQLSTLPTGTLKEIGGQALTSNIFGISTKNYDLTQTLIIDPAPWATYYGGSAADWGGQDISSDLIGNLLVVGYSSSTTNIATTGAYQSTLKGNDDAYLLKLNGSGFPIWATYYGGSLADQAFGLAVDGTNNIFITGHTQSVANIATSGAYQTSLSGGSVTDAFIAKFNSIGYLQWASYFGGASVENGWGIALDLIGNILISGSTSSSSGIATSGAYQTVLVGTNTDAYLAKFTNNGNILWATYFGGSLQDDSRDVTTDINNNVFITGITKSTSGIATLGAFQTVFGGGMFYDAYIAKFNSSGTMQWATYYGSSGDDGGFNIASDLSSNVFITGNTTSSSGIATLGAYQTTTFGGDAFLVKFNSIGARLWGTYFGGTGIEYSYGLCTDTSGEVLISGTTQSANGIATSGSYQSIKGGSYDAFLSKFSTSGAIKWATYIGGNFYEVLNSVYIDLNGSIYACGYTQSTDSLATIGAWQTIYGGGIYDAFIFAIPVTINLSSIANNVISANQGICIGFVPSPLIGSFPLGGDGNYTYYWLSSIIDSNSGFVFASGSNNFINYSPPSLTTNTWFKRIVISAGFYDTSNVIAIVVATKKLNVGFTVNKSIQCIKTNNFIFTDTTTGSNSHLWDFGNGLTSTLISPSISYNFNISNAYWVKLESSTNGGCIDSAKQRVILINNPAPTGAIIGNTIVNKLSTNNYSVPATIGSNYEWIFTNGIGTSFTNSINIKWNVIGTIDLKVIESTGGGCKGDTVYLTITIKSTNGIESFDVYNWFTMYPNPAKSILNVQLEKASSEKILLEIFSVEGKQIKSIWLDPMETQILIETNEITSGMYFIRLNGNGLKQSKRFIIE